MSPAGTGGRAASGAPGKPPLLLVDDDPLILDSFSLALREEYQLLTARDRKQTLALLGRGSRPPMLVLLDLGLPPAPHIPDEGFRLIRELLAFDRDMKILILSGQGDRSHIRRALTLGAVDFIPKPCDLRLLRTRLQHQCMILEAERGRRERAGTEEELLGDSPALSALRDRIRQFSDTPHPVLIEGESGTGKELVARCLHRWSGRARQQYLKLNCAALPGELLESQLFGHARGAFTGASEAREGFLGAAAGSLLFDEIGELPLALQAKLLRVLDDGEYYRLGETVPRRLQARILASTNRDLREEVKMGRFRLDLYHRLSVLKLGVPPLRERQEDALLLFERFRGIYAPGVTLSGEARRMLGGYAFPGNVRELRNIVIRLSAKYPGAEVDAGKLRAELEPPQERGVPAPAGVPPGVPDETELRARLLRGDFRLEDFLGDLERRCILMALDIAAGNLSRAARILGINRTTLYGRMQRLSIRQ